MKAILEFDLKDQGEATAYLRCKNICFSEQTLTNFELLQRSVDKFLQKIEQLNKSYDVMHHCEVLKKDLKELRK